MKKTILFIFSVVITMVSLGLKNSAPAKNVEFKLIKTFGSEGKPADALFSTVYKMTSDNKGNIYLLGNDRITAFKADGTFNWVVKKSGEGPGDLRYPMGIACDGEKYLYIDNLHSTRIDKFDLNGKFISSARSSDLKLVTPFVIGFIKPNLLVVAQSPVQILGADIHVLEAGEKIKHKNSFIVDLKEETKLEKIYRGMPVPAIVTGSKIAIGNFTKYELGVYGSDGKLESMAKGSIKMKSFYKESPKKMNVFLLAPPLLRISGGYYLCILSWPKNEDDLENYGNNKKEKIFMKMMDIYDDKGSLIYSEKFEKTIKPEIGRIIYSDSDGFLYTYKELPYPQICKYRVIISDKK